MKNITVLVVSFVLTFSQVQADSSKKELGVKASYDYTAEASEIDQAEARLKALEESLSEQIKTVESTPEKSNKENEIEAALKKEQELAKSIPTIKEPVKSVEVIEESTKEEPALEVAQNDHSDQDVEALRLEISQKYQKEIESLQAKLSEQEAEVASLRAGNENFASLESELRTKYESELDQLNTKLMLAETEVERLSYILEDQNRKVLGLEPIDRTKEKEVKKVSLYEEAQQNSDMPIVKVSVDKANLRTGPGMNHSPLMELARGSRLVVEQKQGLWYRVIAPNGVRAWIAADITESIPNGFNEDQTTVNVQGYDHSVEARALRLIKKSL